MTTDRSALGRKSRRKGWEHEDFGGGCEVWRYRFATGASLYIDKWSGGYSASFYNGNDDTRIGPDRKTRQAALNDCKRHAVKQRAELVVFGRAKLP